MVAPTDVSVRQIKAFRVAEGQVPSLLLPDGGKYYGDLHAINRVPHGRGTALLGDGTRYGGDWRNGQYHGRGVMVSSAFEYEGDWEEDKMHGRGTILYKDSVVSMVIRGISLITPLETVHKPLEYRGEFHRTHHRHGRGVMTYRNGDVYDGEWNANRRQGQGTMKYESGEKYVGTWESDERNGRGTASYVNGAVFDGWMVKDKREGEGTLTLPNGDVYKGTFHEDEIVGVGTMRYKNGDIYVGEWKDGVRHGRGQFRLARSGATIEGDFINGLIHGEARVDFPGKSTFIGEFDKGERVRGTITWHAENSCYQGDWRGEHMHGLGLMWYANGDFYYGRWVQSKRCGEGNLNYADGAEFSGQFADDKRHGEGILKTHEGTIQAGLWSSGNLASGYQGEWNSATGTLDGIGTLTRPNGDVFFGLLKDGIREGKGFLTTGSGHKVCGEWTGDHLTCRTASINFPSGHTYTGSVEAARRTNGTGIVVDSVGQMYVGTWLGDAQHGHGVFRAMNLNEPQYEPVAADDYAAAGGVNGDADDRDPKDEAADKRAGKTVMSLLSNMFSRSSKSKSGKEGGAAGPKMRIVGYPVHYVVVGNWEAAEVPPAEAVTFTTPQVAISLAEGRLLLQTASSTFVDPVTPTSTGKNAVPVRIGKQQGRATVFFESSACIFQGTWADNRLQLDVPHADAAQAGPETSAAATQVDEISKKKVAGPTCSFCQTTFHFFKKESKCSVCSRVSCSSCLKEMAVATNPALKAYLLRKRQPAGPLLDETTSFRADAIVSACADCFQTVQLETTAGTVWVANGASNGGPGPKLAEVGIDPLSWIIYRGTFARTVPHGQGTLWANGACYIGNFVLGKKQGSATLVYTNGETYHGAFYNDLPDGTGTYRALSGLSYGGLWRAGKLTVLEYAGETCVTSMPTAGCVCTRHGSGQAFYSDGSRYNGQYRDGLRHGTGILQYANGDVYSGAFVDDRLEGLGRMIHEDTVFVGLFLNGARHGRGVERCGAMLTEAVWQNGVLSGSVRLFDTARNEVHDCWFVHGSEETGAFLVPQTVSDGLVAKCSGPCGQDFSFFLRKHHCRGCGRIFCDACSNQRGPVPPHFKLEGPQRLCDQCAKGFAAGSALGIRRYRDGAVYAGSWSNGRRKGRGCYRRANGQFVVVADMEEHTPVAQATGPLRSASSFDDAANLDSPTTGAVRIDPTDGLPACGASEVEAFVKWWNLISSTIRADFPLSWTTFSEISKPQCGFDVDIAVLQTDDEALNEARRQSAARFLPPDAPQAPLHLQPDLQGASLPQPITEESQLAAISQSRLDRIAADPAEENMAPPTRKINAFTPPRPIENTNQQVLWQSWSTQKVPSYTNGVAGSGEECFTGAAPMCYTEYCGMDKVVLNATLPRPVRFSFSANRLDGAVVDQHDDEL